MDFAKKILSKYGWKEGDGLGKNNDGIAKPLKASLKFDNAGLGVDKAAEFNDHWWERCFNEAANNVDVKKHNDGNVQMALKNSDDSVEISTRGYSIKKLRKAKEMANSAGATTYDNFLQSAVLTQSGSEVLKGDHIVEEDIAVTAVKVLTDEELFRACGGRTAHKGARHGLKLSGKLARIEEQERQMLARMQGHPLTEEVEQTKKCKKKKKDKKREHSEEQFTTQEVEALPEPAKKKRKKDLEAIDQIEEKEPALQEVADHKTSKKKCKKEKKQKEQEEQPATLEESVEVAKTKKKKKKHEKNN